MVKCREATILEVEKARNHMHAERDKAWANLAKAQKATHEFEQALQATIRKRTSSRSTWRALGH